MTPAADAPRAILTGAGSARGIGITTAELLVSRGWVVGLTDMDEAGLAANAARLGGEVPTATADIRSEGEVTAAIESLIGRLGRVDALINSAGISRPTKLLETTLEEWEQVFAVNSRGTFLATKATVPAMLEHGYGRIVNISSVSGIRGGGVFGGIHYSASKAAVLGFTRAVARQFAPHGITCNAVAPGLVDTDLATPHMTPEQRTAAIEAIPAGRLGEAEDVAAVIAFLCTRESGYVTGEVIDINGGSHID